MKRFLFILLFFTLVSCDSVIPIKPEDRASTTTVQILALAEQDSTIYKYVVIEDVEYLVDVKNQVVVKKFFVTTVGDVVRFLCAILLVTVCIIILIVFVVSIFE